MRHNSGGSHGSYHGTDRSSGGHIIRSGGRDVFEPGDLFRCAGYRHYTCGGRVLYGQYDHASVSGMPDYEIYGSGKLGDCKLCL